jgi:O-antigen/teichoic acid export membrane protein
VAGNVIKVVVGLVTVPVFVRSLGLWQWGLMALFQAAAGPLVLLDLGVGAATVKRVADSLGRAEPDRAVRAVHTTMLFHAAAGFVGLAILYWSAPSLAGSVFAIPPEHHAVAVRGFRLMGASFAVSLAGSSLLGVLAAHQRFDLLARAGSIGAIVTAAAGLSTALFTGDVVDVILAQTLATAAVTLFNLRVARRLLPRLAILPSWDVESFRASMSFGAGQALAVAGNLIVAWSDRYVLGTRLAPVVIGSYAVAQTVYTHLYGAFYELGEMVFPAVSHRHGAGALGSARSLALLVGWTVTTGFGVVAVTIGVGARGLLQVWLSPEVSSVAAGVLRLLLAGGLFVVASLGPAFFVLGIGRTRLHALSTLLGGGVGVVTALLLLPTTGVEAVGWGLVSGGAARTLMTLLIWWVHFREEMGMGFFVAHAVMPPLIAAGLLAGLASLRDLMPPAGSWGTLLPELVATLLAVAGLQLAVDALVPGARQRRSSVVASVGGSFPRVARFLGQRGVG